MAVATSALALLAAGSAVNSYLGSRQAASGAKKQGEYEASILERNAGFADQQAKDAISLGKDEASQHMAGIRGLIGSQRAASAGQGIALDSGSALNIQEDTAGLGELDLLRIKNNAARTAWGYVVQASDYRSQAGLARMGAKNVAQSYRNQGYTTLLTAAATVGSMYEGSGSSLRVPRGRRGSVNVNGASPMGGSRSRQQAP